MMDAIDLVHDTKRKKLSEEKSSNDGGNLIEKLPNEIIQHILSLIPTVDAVKTSLLSKEWKCRWMSVFNLDFCEMTSDDRELFMNFVDRVMMLHDTTNLQKFSFYCADVESNSDVYRINTWISAAVKHQVQTVLLYFDYYHKMSFALSSCLFTCQSLKVLKLTVFCELKLPSAISLPSLKDLCFKFIKFPDDLSMQRLFSGCPNIQNLTIHECDWKNVKSAIISLPMLEYLDIFEHVIQEEEYPSSGCQIAIFAKSLKTFKFRGEVRNYYSVDFPSLVDASIEVFHSELDQRENAYRLHKLLSCL